MNGTIFDNTIKYLTSTLKSGTNKVTEGVKENVPTVWMANIILLMIACAVIFIASKVTQKFAKLILYFLGIVLIIGIVLNFVM